LVEAAKEGALLGELKVDSSQAASRKALESRYKALLNHGGNLQAKSKQGNGGVQSTAELKKTPNDLEKKIPPILPPSMES